MRCSWLWILMCGTRQLFQNLLFPQTVWGAVLFQHLFEGNYLFIWVSGWCLKLKSKQEWLYMHLNKQERVGSSICSNSCDNRYFYLWIVTHRNIFYFLVTKGHTAWTLPNEFGNELRSTEWKSWTLYSFVKFLNTSKFDHMEN